MGFILPHVPPCPPCHDAMMPCSRCQLCRNAAAAAHATLTRPAPGESNQLGDLNMGAWSMVTIFPPYPHLSSLLPVRNVSPSWPPMVQGA